LRCYTGQDAGLRQKMYTEIGRCLQKGETAFMLVPEQYTLEAELEALEALHLKGSFDFQVLSPARLFTRIFDSAGRPEQTRIDERGRVTLLCALMGDLELKRYKNAQKKPGFAQRMATEIARCKQSGLQPEDLLRSASDMGACALADKLEDTAKVWAAYEDVLAGRFLDGEDERFRALERMPQADFLQGAHIWARGFELVSPALADTLLALESVASEVTLLIPCSSGRDRECWEPVRTSLMRLNRRFQGQIRFQEISSDDAQGEIAHLAREMSAYPSRSRMDIPASLSISPLKTPEEEACYAVGLIRELVRTNGWRYRDCAILCENLPAYADRLRRAATLYGVPLFSEEQRPAVSHSAARYILCALKMIGRGYPVSESRLLLRTGCTSLSFDECDTLSNYIYEFGIRGSMWKKPFTRGGEKRIAQAEPLREKFITPLLTAEARIKAAKTVHEMLIAIWQLAEDAQLAQRLSQEASRLFENGHMVEAAESAQIWNRIIGEFDQLDTLLGQRCMPVSEVARLLETGLCAATVSPLPQSNDAVSAASVSRVRSRPFRAIVIIGAVDSQPMQDDGLFDAGERSQLEESSGVWFPPDGEGRMRLRALDYKNAVSLAREHLAMTWPLGSSGERNAFGYPVRWTKRIYPNLTERSSDAILRTLYSAPEAAAVLASAASRASGTGTEKELARSALLEASVHCPPAAPPQAETHLDALVARKLYGGPMSVHITRLETFAFCPFHHFVQYGLRPYLMRPFEYELRDRGELVHTAMERFFRESPGQETPLEAMARAETIACDLVMQTVQAERMQDDPLYTALTDSLIRRVRAAADAAVFQLEGSQFQVCATETSFGERRPIAYARTRDANIPLSGRIDRMDLAQGERRLIRVVDYKSSRSHTLDLPKLYYSLQLQLPIYLAVASQMYHAEPAGAYYLPAVGLVPKTDETDPAAIARVRRKELALSGVTASDPYILGASSSVPDIALGITLLKDGSPRKSSKVISPDGLSALSDYALNRASHLTDRIRQGEAGVCPLRLENDSACTYCEYAAACQVDAPPKRLPALTSDDALQKILDGETPD